jgi:hypothetical protein
MNRKAGFKHFVQAATKFIQQLARDIKVMRTRILVVISSFRADMEWYS